VRNKTSSLTQKSKTRSSPARSADEEFERIAPSKEGGRAQNAFVPLTNENLDVELPALAILRQSQQSKKLVSSQQSSEGERLTIEISISKNQ
jgi:hypothetical protein